MGRKTIKHSEKICTKNLNPDFSQNLRNLTSLAQILRQILSIFTKPINLVQKFLRKYK
jgi:hypothetical protein